MTSFATRARSRVLSGAKLKGRVAVVRGGTTGVGAGIGRSLASKQGWVGRPDVVTGVVYLVFAGVCSLIAGRVGAVDGGGEV